MCENQAVVDAIKIICEYGYISFSELYKMLGLGNTRPERANFRAALDEECQKEGSRIRNLDRKMANHAFLSCNAQSSNVYYSTQWMSNAPHSEFNEAGRIGYDLFVKIEKNGWNCYQGLVGRLDFQAISDHHYGLIIACDWPGRFTYWPQFEALFAPVYYYELYCEGRHDEYEGRQEEAKRCYESGDAFGLIVSRYRYTKLTFAALDLHGVRLNDRFITGRIVMLERIQNEYPPAGFLLGDLCAELSQRPTRARKQEWYRQKVESGWKSVLAKDDTKLDDEGLLCKAKAFYFGKGVAVDKCKAVDYCRQAKEKAKATLGVGNLEAEKLYEEWNRERAILPSNALREPSPAVASLLAMTYEQKCLQSVKSLGLSGRALICLSNANLKTVGELIKKSLTDMSQYRNFGKKSLNEVSERLAEIGLGWRVDDNTEQR